MIWERSQNIPGNVLVKSQSRMKKQKNSMFDWVLDLTVHHILQHRLGGKILLLNPSQESRLFAAGKIERRQNEWHKSITSVAWHTCLAASRENAIIDYCFIHSLPLKQHKNVIEQGFRSKKLESQTKHHEKPFHEQLLKQGSFVKRVLHF